LQNNHPLNISEGERISSGAWRIHAEDRQDGDCPFLQPGETERESVANDVGNELRSRKDRKAILFKRKNRKDVKNREKSDRYCAWIGQLG
jgi:hypothetical protein